MQKYFSLIFSDHMHKEGTYFMSCLSLAHAHPFVKAKNLYFGHKLSGKHTQLYVKKYVNIKM